MKERLINISLFISTCIILFVIAEILMGILSPQTLAYPNMYQSDDQLGFTLKPNSVFHHQDCMIDMNYQINYQGYRDFSKESKIDTEKPTLLLLGDSFVFGQGIIYEKTFSGLVARYYPDFQTINAAVPGYGPEQYYEILKRVITFGLPVKAIVLGYFVYNDISDTYRDYQSLKVLNGYIISQTDAQNNRLTLLNRINAYIVSRSHILTLIYRLKEVNRINQQERCVTVNSRIDCLYSGDKKKLLEYASQAQMYIYQMDTLLRDTGIPLIVLLIPSELGFSKRYASYRLPEGDTLKFKFPTHTLHRELTSHGIMAVDLWPFLDEKCYIPQDTHFNEKGHQIVFKQVVQYLDKELKTKARDDET